MTALVTFGEGYHSYHHRFPFDYRNGVHWWQYDPSKWLIWSISRLHLVQPGPLRVRRYGGPGRGRRQRRLSSSTQRRGPLLAGPLSAGGASPAAGR